MSCVRLGLGPRKQKREMSELSSHTFYINVGVVIQFRMCFISYHICFDPIVNMLIYDFKPVV